jgi:SAM-dependent methyltransferase
LDSKPEGLWTAKIVPMRIAQGLSKRWPLSQRLIDLSRNTPSHSFLTNPASHNSYLLLLNYMREFSEHWLERPPCSLRVLDWGCGKGFCTLLLKEFGFQVVSCDIARDADDSAFGQETPIIKADNIQVVPLYHDSTLPFDSGSFDLVLSMGVLEHVKDDAASLREIRRVLKPNGLFFCFFLPFVGSWTQFVSRYRGDDYHDRLYTKGRVKALLAATGFELLEIWHRQLFPKNSVRYPAYHLFERLDQTILRFTPLRLLSTNIEFVARCP